GPSISAMVNISPGAIFTEGEIFHPFPRSLAQDAPVPSTACPPSPFPPEKFSGLIERVLIFLSLLKLVISPIIPILLVSCSCFPLHRIVSQGFSGQTLLIIAFFRLRRRAEPIFHGSLRPRSGDLINITRLRRKHESVLRFIHPHGLALRDGFSVCPL